MTPNVQINGQPEAVPLNAGLACGKESDELG